MHTKHATDISPTFSAEWPLPPSATLGSSVRLKGIEREVRRRLPWGVRKNVIAMSGHLSLKLPEADQNVFEATSATISSTLAGIDALPVLPSEAEDILTMSSRERHKWLKDGRLTSIGTRTVKLRGRARAVTFHIFDPRVIEDLLNDDRPALWREEDAQAAADNRRRAAGKAALLRANRRAGDAGVTGSSARAPITTRLDGWETFESEGLLR